MSKDKNTGTLVKSLVESLANKPTFFKHLANYIVESNLGSGVSAAIIGLGNVRLARELYNSLREDKIALVPEQIIPYLLENGLLESLSSIQPEPAKAILKEVLQTSFAKQQNLSEQDIRNLNSLIDNTVTLVHSLKSNPDVLKNIAVALANRIKSPQNINKRLIQGSSATKNEVVVDSITGVIQQLAKTIDDHQISTNGTTLLDQASLYVTEQLKLKPGELTEIAILSKPSMKALLSDPLLAQQLARIPTLEAKERSAEIIRLSPDLIKNQSGHILRALEKKEFLNIIRKNQFIKSQLAAQGFSGQENLILHEVLDNLYPLVIKPALLQAANRANSKNDIKPQSMLHNLLDPEVSIEGKVSSSIDYFSKNREAVKAILSSSLLTKTPFAKALVTRVTTEGQTRKDASALVSPISDIIRRNEESLTDLTNTLLDNSETIKSLISIYEKSKPKVEAPIVQEMPPQTPKKVEYTQEELEKLGITAEQVKNLDSEDLQKFVDTRKKALAKAESPGQVVTSPLHDNSRQPSSEDISPRRNSESLSTSNPVQTDSVESSVSAVSADVTQEPKTLLGRLSDILVDYKRDIPKVIKSATPVVKAILAKDGQVEELAEAYIAYNNASNEKEKEEKFSAILNQAIDIAKDPRVVEATSQAIKDNKDLLVGIIDKKLDELRQDNPSWLLKQINGKFCVKAIQSANTPESLAAIQQFIKQPKISSALYLAWKTKSIKTVIGVVAVAAYLKPKTEEKTMQSIDVVSGPSPSPGKFKKPGKTAIRG